MEAIEILEKTLKSKTISSINYDNDGKFLIFNFTDDSFITIASNWNHGLYWLISKKTNPIK